jgi:ABC-type nickel/cobalt efflux system permease component RcnA
MAKQLAEMREWIARYFSARADALGVRLRFAAVRALFAVGVALGLSSAIATAAVIMVVGLADGLTVLCGDRPWAGELAAGALVLGTTCATVWLGSGSWHRASFDKLRDKYAHRHEEQRKGHPRDVGQRAAENAPPA